MYIRGCGEYYLYTIDNTKGLSIIPEAPEPAPPAASLIPIMPVELPYNVPWATHPLSNREAYDVDIDVRALLKSLPAQQTQASYVRFWLRTLHP